MPHVIDACRWCDCIIDFDATNTKPPICDACAPEAFTCFDWTWLGNGWLQSHPKHRCEGESCSVHNPSDHSMREWPRLWRGDRGLMERVCSHGVGHPDPDDIAWKARVYDEQYARDASVHGGCCGCCVGVPA